MLSRTSNYNKQNFTTVQTTVQQKKKALLCIIIYEECCTEAAKLQINEKYLTPRTTTSNIIYTYLLTRLTSYVYFCEYIEFLIYFYTNSVLTITKQKKKRII